MESILGPERRGRLRISGPYPALVRGRAADGARFEEDTFVDNLSARGLYLKLGQAVAQGAYLFLIVQLATGPDDLPPPRVAIRGSVARVEPKPEGGYGLAVMISRHRFLDDL
ncbi:MAG TPA: hypothetical protein VE262_01170 [Blastocatellia bacterium]|nr:hypothetical protein [Blastocatellia bacterium]